MIAPRNAPNAARNAQSARQGVGVVHGRFANPTFVVVIISLGRRALMTRKEVLYEIRTEPMEAVPRLRAALDPLDLRPKMLEQFSPHGALNAPRVGLTVRV